MICAPTVMFEAPALDPAAEYAPGVCGWALLDLAGRGALVFPDTGISRALTLPRARAEGRLAVGDVAVGRVAVAAVRSGGDAGYIGIDGEALVPEIQLAEARGAWAPLGVAMAAGLVEDPWVVGADEAWGLRPLQASFGESMGWMDSSDLGGWLGWTSPRRVIALRVDLASGEGARFRERNEGKNLAGTATLRPVDTATSGLAFTVYGRDGSRGLGLARDHRFGIRASGHVPLGAAGVEGLATWGVDGDAGRQPLGGSAWLVAHPWGPLLAYGRVDLASEALGQADAGTRVLLLGAGVELPSVARPPLRVVVGYTGTRVGAAVADVAGSTALDNTDAVFLQLGVTLETRPD